MSNRREFCRQTKVDMAKRAMRPDGQMACELCGAIGVRLEAHHKEMDAMVLAEDKRKRKLTADDGLMICVPCHDEITGDQRKVLAKAQAVEAAHLGVKREPTRKIASRVSAKVERTHASRAPAAGMTEIARRYGVQTDKIGA
ncbi:MAG: hypothetical protein JO107_16280 [Hyphomicrobiales bacterium]|nr:hypothetical protein [Hyphomicrobiales bacterium]